MDPCLRKRFNILSSYGRCPAIRLETGEKYSTRESVMALMKFNTRGESPSCGEEGVTLGYISHSLVAVRVVFQNDLHL
jgi:hypothetical protein